MLKMNTIPTRFSGKTLSFNTDDVLVQVEANFINERGDKMRGNLNMNGNKIINVSKPNENTEVVNKEYIDDMFKIYDTLFKKLTDDNIKSGKFLNKLKEDFNKSVSSIRDSVSKKVEDFTVIETSMKEKIKDFDVLCKTSSKNINDYNQKIIEQNKIIKTFETVTVAPSVLLFLPQLDLIRTYT